MEGDSEAVPAEAAEEPLADPLVRHPRTRASGRGCEIGKRARKFSRRVRAHQHGADEPRPKREVEPEDQRDQRREREEPGILVELGKRGAEPVKGAGEKTSPATKPSAALRSPTRRPAVWEKKAAQISGVSASHASQP